MNWFCSRSHIFGLIWCQAQIPVLGVWSRMGKQLCTTDRRAVPLALALWGKQSYVGLGQGKVFLFVFFLLLCCGFFLMLCLPLWWWSARGEVHVAALDFHCTYSRWILPLLPLNFPSMFGVHIPVAVLTQVSAPKRLARWQQRNAYPLGSDFSLKLCMGSITRRCRKEDNWWLPSVLHWWLPASGTKQKGSLTENWDAVWEVDWRMLLFEPRKGHPSESTGVWHYYSVFLAWFQSLLSYPGYGFLS